MINLAALLASGSTTVTTVASNHTAGSSIFAPIAKPIGAVLAAIYSVVPNYGVAILVLSVIWMVIISPLTLKSTRSMLAMQKLQPELKRLQQKHANDRQAFAQAQMELFREHQVSPFGSCLPMLLPLPVFFALFKVIDGLSHKSKIGGVSVATPQYLSPGTAMYKAIVHAGGHLNAFGMDLSHNAFSSHANFFTALPYWILLLIMGGTSYMQSAMMMGRNPGAMQNNPQMRMMKFLPLIFVVFCIRFPAGVILYYAMSNVCRIVQQDAMYRFDPKVKALVAQEVLEVEAHTQEIDEEQGAGGGPSGAKGSAYTPPRGPKPAATPPPAGRSRFRDLLAAASEQQQKGRPPKPSGSPPKVTGRASSPASNGKTDSKPGLNGQGSGGGSNGAPPRGRKNTGHRTNRKRRRR